MFSTSVLTCPFPSSENSISGHLLKFIVQLFLLDLGFTTNNLWGKKGCSVLHLNLHGTNRKTKTNERYFRRDSISQCLHLGFLELAFSLHGMSVCTLDSIYLRLILGTLHSLI